MAIRKIVKFGDEVLEKECRKVEKFDKKLHQLLDDMKETLADANGAGLAAPQDPLSWSTRKSSPLRANRTGRKAASPILENTAW